MAEQTQTHGPHKHEDGELLVQAAINRGNADAGDSGGTVEASAMLSVLVTWNGRPMDDLGGSVLFDGGGVVLPAGWTLRDEFNVRPGGCKVTVIEFLNQGGGVYDLRLVPFVDNPACTWLSGEYVYSIQIEATRTIGGRTVALSGGTLAKLAIP
jgi:hypothetical protein